MPQGAYRRWLSRQPPMVLLALLLVMLGLIFGASVLWWWVAQHLSWWVYGLLTAAQVFAVAFGKAAWRVSRRSGSAPNTPATDHR